MLRIKPYLGSKSTEDYLNKKAQKGYELESITSFGLFVPLRLDAYSSVSYTHLTLPTT